SLPRLSEVGSLECVRRPVVRFMTIDRHVRRSGIEMPSFNQTDAAVVQNWSAAGIGKIFRTYIRPVLSSVGCDVNQTIVASRPDCSCLQWRLGNRKYGAIVLSARVVLGDRTTGRLLRALDVTGEVGTDLLPVIATIACLQHYLSAVVNHVGIVGRDHDWRRPLEAILEIHVTMAHGIQRPGIHLALDA